MPQPSGCAKVLSLYVYGSRAQKNPPWRVFLWPRLRASFSQDLLAWLAWLV